MTTSCPTAAAIRGTSPGRPKKSKSATLRGFLATGNGVGVACACWAFQTLMTAPPVEEAEAMAKYSGKVRDHLYKESRKRRERREDKEDKVSIEH
jgi:hypothetical protein